MPNALYYGDNLAVLRESIPTESVDLVYLDPPFNSNHHVLFKAKSGEQSQAQIEAFEDTWHWNDSAELAFNEVVTGQNSDASIEEAQAALEMAMDSVGPARDDLKRGPASLG